MREKGEKTNISIPFWGNKTCIGDYSGELNENGQPDGEGTFTGTWTKTTDGNEETVQLVYTGSFENGVAKGSGTTTETHLDGHIVEYVGEFDNNTWNGEAVLTYTYQSGNLSKDIFEGTWTSGSLNGQSKRTIYCTNGNVNEYVGEFADGKYNGKGVRTNTFAIDDIGREKQIIEGEYIDGKLSGNNCNLTNYYKDGTKEVSIGKYFNDKYVDITKTTYDANGNVTETKKFDYSSQLKAPTNFNAEINGLKAKVTWDSVENATGYETDIWGETHQYPEPYTNLTGTEDTKTVDVKVRAFAEIDGVKYYSDWGEFTYEYPAEGSAALSMPANFKATCKDGTAELTWDDVDGATGYEYDYIGYTGDLPNASANINNLREGEKATVKIRAYAEKDGNRTYSDWETVTFTYKES